MVLTNRPWGTCKLLLMEPGGFRDQVYPSVASNPREMLQKSGGINSEAKRKKMQMQQSVWVLKWLLLLGFHVSYFKLPRQQK